MENKEFTEMELVLQRTVERLSQRVASLTLDLDLAHSQIEILKDQEAAAAEAKIVEDEKNTKKK